MRVSAWQQAVAPLRIFATTLYYGFRVLTDSSLTNEDSALKQYALIAPCLEDGVSQKNRATETGVSRKTLGRLIGKFKAGGIEALRRKTRSDTGKPRVSENTFKFIKGKLLTHPQLSFATIHRQLDRLGSHAAEFTASYQQIRRIRTTISEDLLVLARSEREFEETRELLIRREAAFPNDIYLGGTNSAIKKGQINRQFTTVFNAFSRKEPNRPAKFITRSRHQSRFTFATVNAPSANLTI